MKKTFVLSLLALCALSFNVVSCNDEELFVEETIVEETPEEVEETPEDTDDDDTSEEEETTEEEDVAADPTQPCDFTLSNLAPNSTVIINCIMDLEGATVDIPAGVTIVYEGGDIINGTLNFLGDAEIGGELLNNTFTITGSTPQVKADYFEFDPKRWGIVEGKVDDMVAYENKLIINRVLADIANLGITEIRIDKMDAYFQTQPNFVETKQTPQDAAIQVPANVHLIMTDNTHLRVQPNNYKNTVLLTVFKADNSTVDGGILHGDRDEHDYSDGGTHEWGHLVLVKASNNVVIKNMTLMDAGGDALDVNALGHSHDAFYTRAYNVLITGNTMIRSRRNHVSITDGYDIVIENNEFIDASIHTSKSDGVAPGYAIDVEAVRPSEEAEDIIVRNNIERGSRVGAFTVHTGNRVTIDGNTVENKISYSTSIGTIIKNNICNASVASSKNGTAIVAGRNDRGDRNYGNRVYGNIIKGFSTGIKISNTDLEVYDNEINNCNWGIVIDYITNSKVYNNSIKSTNKNSDGIVAHPTGEYMDQLSIVGNTVEVDRVPFRFVGVNNKPAYNNYSCTVENNLFKGTSVLSGSYGFVYKNNTNDNGQVQLVNCNNISILQGEILAANLTAGIRFMESNTNITIDETVIVSGGSDCIIGEENATNVSISNINCTNN